MSYFVGGTLLGPLTLNTNATPPAVSTANQVRMYYDGSVVKASFNGAAYATFGAGSAAQQFIYLGAANGIAPASGGFPALTIRNNHTVLGFDDASAETIEFESALDTSYGAGTITCVIQWAAASATSGDVVWGIAWEALAAAGQDLDSDGFASERQATSTTSGTSGVLTYTTITFTQAQADNIAAGNSFRIRVKRDAAAGGDTMTGDAQILSVTISA